MWHAKPGYGVLVVLVVLGCEQDEGRNADMI